MVAPLTAQNQTHTTAAAMATELCTRTHRTAPKPLFLLISPHAQAARPATPSRLNVNGATQPQVWGKGWGSWSALGARQGFEVSHGPVPATAPLVAGSPKP